MQNAECQAPPERYAQASRMQNVFRLRRIRLWRNALLFSLYLSHYPKTLATKNTVRLRRIISAFFILNSAFQFVMSSPSPVVPLGPPDLISYPFSLSV